MAFCPKFFESDRLMYLEERTNGKNRPYGEIAQLDTYERIIIHEYMHVDLIRFQPGHSKLSFSDKMCSIALTLCS